MNFPLLFSVPSLPAPGLAIEHVMSLSERVSDLTIPLGDPLHLGKVVRPKLDHSDEQKTSVIGVIHCLCP